MLNLYTNHVKSMGVIKLKNVLQYTILGLLNHQALTGYEIYKSFSEVIGEIWSAKHSQIYNELKKLLESEHIFISDVDETSKVTKKIYRITPLGQKTLYHWIETADEEENNKDPFAIKVYFYDYLKAEEKKNLLVSKQTYKLEKLSYLESIFKSLDSTKDAQHIRIVKKAILREQAYIDWLDFCLSDI
ncbi:PadR family transcriptional regulator [Staphylococcus nepalensis]|uniref:PadR family transcriptional regulator n=1 Tax=Staphylococcus nepalensis TaxID=214473 RepID=A0A2T4SED3_9STAP|nr:PadR family transcriptional regulator [Staphylococcus nepalensis]PTK61026.1 PadR family transcriptional regulator [Staphylococcus nepalensis]